MAFYLFNLVPAGDDGPAQRELAEAYVATGVWGIEGGEPRRDELGPGDHALLYLGAPVSAFVGSAVLASPAHDWTPAEAQGLPGGPRGGVALARVDRWDPPVPMAAVLARMAPTEKAKPEFATGLVRITVTEWETALAVAGR